MPPPPEERRPRSRSRCVDAQDQLAFVAAGLAAFTLNLLDGHEHSEEELCWAVQDVLGAVDEVGAHALAECAAISAARL